MLQVTLIWVGLVAGMMAAAEAGFRAHVWFRKRAGRDLPGATDTIMGGVLALTGLLLAFSFGTAHNHYDERRRQVVSEANAISTTLLRQEVLAAPDRARLAPLMRDYVSARRTAVTDNPDERAVLEAQRRTVVLQTGVWAATSQALRTPQGALIATPLLLTTNEMFDAAEAQRAAHDVRIPARTLRVLIFLAIGSASLLGVGLASRQRREPLASGLLFALLALTMTLVYDLDAPNLGGIHTPHDSMDRLAASLPAVQAPPP